jgi:hypothetical protein
MSKPGYWMHETSGVLRPAVEAYLRDEPMTEAQIEATGARRCGDCSLCCKLLPNVALDKPAGQPCRFQRHGKGCKIYPNRPSECAIWSCRWLIAADETAGMRRPDRAHYVIDPLPDAIRMTNNETGEAQEFEALQIWIDPAFPATKDDPELRAYMLRMAQQTGMPSLLRWSNWVATAVFPPPLNADGEWHATPPQDCSTEFGRYSRLPAAWRDSLAKSP